MVIFKPTEKFSCRVNSNATPGMSVANEYGAGSSAIRCCVISVTYNIRIFAFVKMINHINIE